MKTRRWGEVKYPKGMKPIVIEAKIEGVMDRRPYVETIVIKEGAGIKKETDIPAVIKVLEEKAKNEVPIDAKVEFSIHFPKTRKKPVKFVAVGGQPLEPRLVVPSGGYEIPDQLREDIRKEWKKHPKRKTATDLEAMTYLMSASALGRLKREYASIYRYLMRKYLKNKGKSFKGVEFLKRHKTLTDYEKRKLQELKNDIWRDQQKDLKERQKRARQLAKECPSAKIRSGGKGLGLGRGKGKGPIGIPIRTK